MHAQSTYKGDNGAVSDGSIALSTPHSCIVRPIEIFKAYGQPCSACSDNRYLACVNRSCHCLPHTYWTGFKCAPQLLLGAHCTEASQCRTDLNYTCLQFFQCGRKCRSFVRLFSNKVRTFACFFSNAVIAHSTNSFRKRRPDDTQSTVGHELET
jgi:hypothetical protein